MKTRPSFVCWQCERTFGLVVDLAGDPVLLLECPYCSAQCKVDLYPYRARIVTVMRDQTAGPGDVRYELPARIPTSEPGDETPTPET
ncbi:hypothetical protein [Candidatus Thiosymbion oneisti]|uniref:hypothetical protein n=1 Tax=Candidatus Thiosymbion oneisti TaxID=589554 RepID=UPI000B7E1570|nr:hypothetical protein [Candidatus Thiosymbion oneisti]